MAITQQQIIDFGYLIPAAPPDDWRVYDEAHPVPGYFDFDWLSSRHPDLYHKFALTSTILMQELHSLLDLADFDVLDIGAGTGRSTIEAAKKAHRVTAVDIFPSVISFGKEFLRQAGLRNVDYVRADCNHLPFPAGTMDACLTSWSIIDFSEAQRVLKPGGYLVWLGPAPGALCGELTATLANVYPDLITEIAPPEQFDSACPPSDSVPQSIESFDLPDMQPTLLHDFTCLAEYDDYQEAAALLGRLYGPAARHYLLERQQSTLAWRLRIAIFRK